MDIPDSIFQYYYCGVFRYGNGLDISAIVQFHQLPTCQSKSSFNGTLSHKYLVPLFILQIFVDKRPFVI